MSTDWNIGCVDCNEVHGFDDANHQHALMLAICRHAPAIAALAPLQAETPDLFLAAGFRGRYGAIEASWFAKHAGHRLAPISEYGDYRWGSGGEGSLT